jgi:hypothetical protein
MCRLVPLLLALAASACCADGAQYLEIWMTAQQTPDSPACEWEGPAWGGVTTATAATNVMVLWGDADSGGRTRAVEVFDIDAEPVEVEEATSLEGSCANGCPSGRTLYVLPMAPADYTLVHRESRGNGLPVWLPYGGEWTTWEGERTLVTTLRITNP